MGLNCGKGLEEAAAACAAWEHQEMEALGAASGINPRLADWLPIPCPWAAGLGCVA